MLDVEESKDGGSIVGDGCVFMGGDHFVHASGTEGGLDDVDDSLDGVDVGDDLSNAFHGISAVSEEQDGGL